VVGLTDCKKIYSGGNNNSNGAGRTKGLGWMVDTTCNRFIFYPIRLAASFYNDFLPMFREGYWEVLTTPGSEAYHHLWAPLIISEIIGNSLFIIFDIVLIVLFFTKSYRFPILIIIFIATNLFFVAGDLVLVDLIPAVAAESGPESVKELIRSIITAAIWIPYFLVSKRVKNTFVKKEPNKPLVLPIDAPAD
jgi:hypothetical protein